MARTPGVDRSVNPRWHGAVAAVTTAALVVAAGAFSPTLAQQETPSAPAEQIAAGVAVYKAQYCGACHTLSVTGSRGTFGPSHDDMAATAAQRLADPDYAGSADTPEAYLRESILEPTVYLVPGFAMTPHAMPSFAHLTPEDVDALVALLLAQ